MLDDPSHASSVCFLPTSQAMMYLFVSLTTVMDSMLQIAPIAVSEMHAEAGNPDAFPDRDRVVISEESASVILISPM